MPLVDQFLAIAARATESVFLDNARVTDEDHRSWLFLSPVDRLVCASKDELPGFFARAVHFLAQGYYLAGWFAYEFGYLLESSWRGPDLPDSSVPLADLGVYQAPFVFDHHAQSLSGPGPLPVSTSTEPQGFSLAHLRLNLHKDEYLSRIERIKRYIETGDTYQVNYTLKYLFDCEGSDEALYQSLRRNQGVSYAAYLKRGGQRILSFSPELFFRRSGDLCTVRPMKGTMLRGRTIREDEAFKEALALDAKNRSENIMIVDLLRNDLGRLCRMGEVAVASLFDVETYETLHQMTSTIRGMLAPQTSFKDLLAALFPCGSVTGAPKIRTMEIIGELEREPRGVYTGAIGYVSPHGDAVFSVPIRTVVLNGSHGEMGIGSGVVYDSDPEREWEECRLKGNFLVDPAPAFQLIETMLWQPGSGCRLLPLHMERLAGSARYFGFVFDKESVEQALAQVAEGFLDRTPQRVRLLLHKDGETSVSAKPFSPPSSKEGRPKVILSPKRTKSSSPFVFHKTTVRPFYEEEHRKARQQGCIDVFFLNENNELTEGAISNIFIKKGGIFLTPPVESGLLDGVFRRHFLMTNPGATRVVPLSVKDLKEADAVYLTNAVRGMVQVDVIWGW